MDVAPAEPIVLLDRPNAPLVGARLRRKRCRKWSGAEAPTFCLACGEGFTEGGEPGLTSGYSVAGGGPGGQDDYRWICAICYEGLREGFDAAGRAVGVHIRLR